MLDWTNLNGIDDRDWIPASARTTSLRLSPWRDFRAFFVSGRQQIWRSITCPREPARIAPFDP
jgi:hypothetical protein